MNGFQIVVVLFSILVVVISFCSAIVVAKSHDLKFKPLWLIGCFLGFVGLGIDWTKPDDLTLLFGVTFPVVMVFKVMATGQVIVKTGLPIVAIVALAKLSGDNAATDN